MDEFSVFMVKDIVTKAFEKFEQDKVDEEERIYLEESWAEARKFRSHSLAKRFFNRWRANAKASRLSKLRRSGRDQVRDFYEKKRAVDERKRLATAAARERATPMHWGFLGTQRRPGSRDSLDNADNVQELRDRLKQRKDREEVARLAEATLLETGILSGIPDERTVAADIIRESQSPATDQNVPPTKPGIREKIKSGLSKSAAIIKPVGAKTRALRDMYGSSTMRKTMPTLSPRIGTSPTPPKSKRVSKVSTRWQLKARGLVVMPDGTALPESLAYEMKYEGKRYPGLGTFGLPAETESSRRASYSDADFYRPAIGHRGSASMSSMPQMQQLEESSPVSKRKRFEADEEEEDGSSNKRVASDPKVAKTLQDIQEMKELIRQEQLWFKEQAEELMSQRATPASDWR